MTHFLTRQRMCTIPRCNRPVERNKHSCPFCEQYLCPVHWYPPFHSCLTDPWTWENTASIEMGHIKTLQALINDDAVCRYASALNGGRKCRVVHATSCEEAMTGGSHYNAPILFDDASPPWLLRVRRFAHRFHPDLDPLADQELMTEYATLKFLETTTVPTPRAFGIGLRSRGPGANHGVGLSFMLIEKLPGKTWRDGGGVLPTDRNHKRKEENLWNDYAEILAELARHPFLKIGSLTCELPPIGAPPTTEVGPISVASMPGAFNVLDPWGPFDDAEDYYHSFIEHMMGLISDGELYCDYPVDAYLAYRFLYDNVHQLLDTDDSRIRKANARNNKSKSKSKSNAQEKIPKSKPEQPPGPESAKEQFYLKHPDDAGHHLLGDANLRITGIIDWELTRVVPAREAFGPSAVTADLLTARGMWGRDPTSSAGITARDEALAEALEKKRGGGPLAELMRGDEKARRFFRGLMFEYDWEPEGRYAAEGLLDAFGVKGVGWEEWKAGGAMAWYLKTDERLRRLKRLDGARRARPDGHYLRDLGRKRKREED